MHDHHRPGFTMRRNLPITETKVPVPEHYTLISHTDLKGRITLASEQFCEISGYSREQLIGQPHNLLRHPDVPEAVFADLWQSLARDRSWSAVLKNRCANGDHYWVRASVSPLVENGRKVGYISVRRPVRAETIEQAKADYQAINQGKAVIHGAQVLSRLQWRLACLNPFRRFRRLADLPLAVGQQLLLSLLPMFASLLILGLLALWPTIQGSPLLGPAATTTVIVLLLGGSLAVLWPMSRHIRRSVHQVIDVITEVERSGRFDRRVIAEDMADELSQLGHRSNLLLARVQRSLAAANDVTHAVARGHFSARHQDACDGDLAVFQSGLNAALGSLDLLADDIEQVMQALSDGDLGRRMESTSGPLSERVNTTLDQLQGLLAGLGKSLSHLSVGEFDQQLTLKARGELARLADTANRAMATLADSVRRIGHQLDALADGDLSERSERAFKGQLEEQRLALDNSMDHISSLVSAIKQAGLAVNKMSESLAQTGQQLAEGTQRQAAALEQTSASMEEISAASASGANHAREVAQRTNSIRETVHTGRTEMQRSQKAMQDIDQAAVEINTLVSTIDHIAFRTNLLALNAAVEAAHAGEHGRGFGIVAQEVRELANQCAEQARVIRTTVESVNTHVAEGVNQTARTAECLEQIDTSVREADQLVEQLAASTREQSQNVEQIRHTIADLDRSVQESAASAESLAQHADRLEQRAADLQQRVSGFRT